MREISSMKINEEIGCSSSSKILSGSAEIEKLAILWKEDLEAVLSAKRQIPNLKIVRFEDILDDGFLKNLENYMQLPLRGE